MNSYLLSPKIVGWLLLLTTLSLACKRKKVSDNLLNQSGGNVAASVPYTQAWAMPAPAVKYLSTKAKFSFRSPDQSIAGVASLRLVNDSACWVSITGPFGIEGFRMILYPDSVKLWDKLEGTRFTLSNQQLQSFIGFPLSLGQLQSLLFGRCPFPEAKTKAFQTDSAAIRLVYRESNHQFTGIIAGPALPLNQLRWQEIRQPLNRGQMQMFGYGPLPENPLLQFPFRKKVEWANLPPATNGKPTPETNDMVELSQIELEHQRVNILSSPPEMPW